MNDRDMFYNSYGYGGFTPANGMNFGMSSDMMMPNMMSSGTGTGMSNQVIPNNYATSQFNDMNERVSRLERQVKRLEQRLTRLETPYANSNNLFNNEPDNNMYMM